MKKCKILLIREKNTFSLLKINKEVINSVKLNRESFK